jgi:tRNA (guanine-N7-)-methyltransferase
MMNSSAITTNQSGVHPALGALVQKHATTAYLRPVATFSRTTFAGIRTAIEASCKRHIILDSGCGTGESTGHLAALHPDAFVLGLDRSLLRLKNIEKHIEKHNESCLVTPDNYAVFRASLEDAWRLLAEECTARDWKIDAHYLLYPNPYPKAHHIMRRWHGHPLFAPMLALAPRTVLRTNWRIYAEEFAEGAQILGYQADFEELANITEALTAFERKYAASNHALFQVTIAFP